MPIRTPGTGKSWPQTFREGKWRHDVPWQYDPYTPEHEQVQRIAREIAAYTGAPSQEAFAQAREEYQAAVSQWGQANAAEEAQARSAYGTSAWTQGWGASTFPKPPEAAAESPTPYTDPSYRNVIGGAMMWGYGRQEIVDILEASNRALSVGEARDYLGEHMRSQYGAFPKGQVKSEEGYSMFPWQWRQFQEHERLRLAQGIPGPIDPATRKPIKASEQRVEDWPAGMFTRQGASHYYPVSLLGSSTHMLPGAAPGSVLLPPSISEGKFAKRAQLFGAHESLTVYEPGEPYGSLPGAQRRAMEAPMRSGPGAEVPEPGFRLRAGIPLAEVLPSGMGLLKPGVIGAIAERRTVRVPVPEGTTPTGVPGAGHRWNLRRGEQVIPFEGASPIDMGSWEGAHLIGGAERAQLPAKGGELKDYMVYTFERAIRPASGSAEIKTWGHKLTLPEARSREAFEKFVGGRTDIEAILPPKEWLGVAYETMMAESPETLAALIGQQRGVAPGEVTAADIRGMSWSGAAGKELVRAFAERVPGMIENIPYTFRMTTQELEAVPEERTKYIAQRQPVGKGLWEVTTAPIPTLVPPAGIMTAMRRGYPGKVPTVRYRELERLQRTSPDLYRSIMMESRPYREAYGGLAAAAYSSARGISPGNVAGLTPEMAMGVVTAGQAAAMQATGTEELSDVPRDILSRSIIEQARGAWGHKFLGLGEGRFMLPASAMLRLGAPGVMEGEEASALGRRYAAALQEFAGGGQAEAVGGRVGTFMSEQMRMAGGKNIIRGMLGAPLPRTGSEGTVLGATGIPANLAYLPPQKVMEAYGLTNPEVRGEFMEAWETGRIRPPMWATRFPPTGGDEPFKMRIGLMSPREAKRYGVNLNEETQAVVGTLLMQANSGDWDADRMLKQLLGRVVGRGEEMRIEGAGALTPPERIEEMAQFALRTGAANLMGEEFLSSAAGIDTPEKLQEFFDVSKWKELAPGQQQKLLASNLALQKQIGPIYNVLEAMETQGRRGGATPAQVSAATTVFGLGYGTAQRPAELPQQLQQMMDVMRSGKIWTGGYVPSGAEDPRGFAGAAGIPAMYGELARRVMRMTMPTQEGSRELLSTSEAAAMLAPLGWGQEQLTDIEAGIGRWQRYMRGGQLTRAGLEAGSVLKQAGGLGLENISGTLLGASTIPLWYRRMERFLATPESEMTKRQREKELPQARKVMASIPEGTREQIEASRLAIMSRRGAMAKYKQEGMTEEEDFLYRFESSMIEAPGSFQRAGALRGVYGAAQARASGQVDVVDPATGEVTLQTAPAQPPSAAQAVEAVQSAPGNRTQRLSQRMTGLAAANPDWSQDRIYAEAIQQEAWEGFGEVPFGPPGSRTGGSGGGGTGGSGGATAAAGAEPPSWVYEIMDRQEQALRRLSPAGVHGEEFSEAISALSAGLPVFQRQYMPRILAGEELNRGDMGFLKKLGRYRWTAQRAMAQGGWAGGAYGETSEIASQMRGFMQGPFEGLAEPYRVLGDYTRQARINEMLQLGNPRAGQDVLAWLNQATPQELQALPGIGPMRAGRVAGTATRFGNLQNVPGFTGFGQLTQISGISAGMLPNIEQSAIGEAAWWQAGGRGAVSDLFGALQGVGLETPGGYAQYGAALSGPLGTLRRNVAALQNVPGAKVPKEVSQWLASVGAMEHRYQKETAAAGVGPTTRLTDEAMENFRKRLEALSPALENSTEKLKEWTEILEKGGKLTSAQERELKQIGWTQRQVTGTLRGIAGTQPGAQFLGDRPDLAVQAEQAGQALWDIQAAQAMAPPGFWDQGVGGAIGGIGRKLMSGWGLMQMRRMWGMTGGAAMGQIPVAAQYEQAGIGAAMAGMPLGEYQPGGMALDLMSYQANQQAFKIGVGQGAYGGFGWTQQALTPGVGQALGIGGVAAGAGLIAQLLGSWGIAGATGMTAGAAFGPSLMTFGLPVAGATLGIGSAAWAGTQMGDREKMAIAAASGPTEQPIRWALSQVTKLPEWAQRGVPPVLAALGQPALAQMWNTGVGLSGYNYEQQQGLEEYGQQLLGGDVTGLSAAGRAAAYQNAVDLAMRKGGFLGREQGALYGTGIGKQQALQMAGQWINYGWGEDVNKIFSDQDFVTMGQLGMEPSQFAGQALNWGLSPTTGGQRMWNITKGLPEGQARVEWGAGQEFYAPFARFGLEPEQAAGFGFPEGAQEQYKLRRLAQGDRYAWSEMGRQMGVSAWQTASAEGMGIGTNWGGDILGGYTGQVGRPGENVNVSGGQITFNVTGQQVGFNQWDVQDYATRQQRGYEDWQFGFRERGLNLQRAYQTQAWGLQEQMSQLQYGRQIQQLGFQREGLALGDQQFKERWDLSWQQAQRQAAWQGEDIERQYGRQLTRFDWAEEDLAFSAQQASLQFGWQMEDFEEAERFATGRDRRRIQRQRERATIQYGMRMGRVETEEERLDQRRDWAEEDYDLAKQRHEEQKNWRLEELRLQREHHEEQMDLSERRLDATETYYHQSFDLQEQQRKLNQRYWLENHERQVEALKQEREYREIVREVQDAQLSLARAQQLHLSRFAAMYEEGNMLDNEMVGFFERFRAEFADLGNDLDLYLPPVVR